jgi:DNA-directed RNA polymerase specialized sigma24 family protein
MGAPLSPPQRESLALAFYDGLSHAEIASAMDQTPTT